jgi:hypothetical protein
MSTFFRWSVILCAVNFIGATPVSAGLVFYTSASAFAAAAPPLSTQTFSSATISNGLLATFAGPLNSSTNNGVFSTGSILAGMSLAAPDGHGSNLDAVAPSIFGDPAKAIYNDYGGDSLNASFSSTTTAVGMGLLNPDGSSVLVSVYNPAGTLLGSQTVTVNSDGPSVFFGVISTGTDQIGQIQLLGNTTRGAAEIFAGLDSLAFGGAPLIVPEPSSLVLATLGAACVLLGQASRRARSCRTV